MTTERAGRPGNARKNYTRVDAASAAFGDQGATERGRNGRLAKRTEPPVGGHSEPLEPLLTPAEVCRLLRISEKTLYRWAYLSRHGETTGPVPVKIGGANRYRRRDVYAYMNPERSP